MDNTIFRSALNGFNRQDVMAYIEKTQKEAAEAAAALERQLASLREELDTASQSLAACAQEKEELTRELADTNLRYTHAKTNWDGEVEKRTALEADLARERETAGKLDGENQSLTARVQALEAQADTVRREKAQVAQLELEARDRAAAMEAQAAEEARITTTQAEAQAAATVGEAEEQANTMLSAARERAAALLQEAEDQIAGTVEQYAGLFDSFSSITSHVTSELRKMDVTVSQLPINFNHLKDGLQGVLDRAKER